MQRGVILFAACAALIVCLPDVAFAGTAGVGMPYEGPLNRILASLTGPVAMTMSIVGVTLAGIGLIFGGSLDGFFKTLINMAFAISIVFGAATLITNVFGGTGAEISSSPDSGRTQWMPDASKTVAGKALAEG